MGPILCLILREELFPWEMHSSYASLSLFTLASSNFSCSDGWKWEMERLKVKWFKVKSTMIEIIFYIQCLKSKSFFLHDTSHSRSRMNKMFFLSIMAIFIKRHCHTDTIQLIKGPQKCTIFAIYIINIVSCDI